MRLCNDLGRIIGYIKNRSFPFIRRFDFFTTIVSINYERKIAGIKFIVFSIVTEIFISYSYVNVL